MSLDELVDEKVDELKNRDNVRAIAIVGSYAREPDMNHNDIDIYVIVEGEWRRRETFEENGQVWEIFYNSMNWIKSYFDEEKWYMYHWIKNRDVRYDPENLFEELEELSEEFKREQFDIDTERISYGVWDFIQDIESKDVAQKRFLMYQTFDYIIKQHYLVCKQPLVKENYRLEKLKEFDGYMYKLSQEFLNSSSTAEKRRKLDDIIQHFSKKLGKQPNPRWKTDKEKLN